MADDSQFTDDPVDAAEPEVIIQLTRNDPASTIAVSEGGAETADARSGRQKITDHLLDTEGPQHISAIIQGTGLDRRVADPILSRGVKAGIFRRVAEAVYELAPPAPEPEPLPPAPQDVPRADGISASKWLAWLWEHYRTGRWQGPGKPPHPVDGIMTGGCLVPFDVWVQFQGELAAVLQREQEDVALRDRLIVHAHGNVISRSPGLNDLSAIRVALASGVPIELIEQAVRYCHDRRNLPSNPPLASWRGLLPRIAEQYGRFHLAKKMLAKWEERLADATSNTDQSPVLRRAMAEIAPEKAPDKPEALPDHPGLRSFKAPRRASPVFLTK